jgi:CheY-like chemotaxis protein
MSEGPPVVAIINSSPDVVDMMRLALGHAGLVAVSAFTHQVRDGEVDIEAFITQHQPAVILYDIAPPYDANWLLFLHIRRMPIMEGRRFILTSTNARHVEGLAGPNTPVYEIVGKPFDLDRLVEATLAAVRS